MYDMFVPHSITGVLISAGGTLLCILIGLVLMSGRGARMIAGYNTMSKDERNKVNEKALCKAVGVYMIILGVILGIMIYAALLSIKWLVYILITFIIVSAIPFVIFINKSKRFKI